MTDDQGSSEDKRFRSGACFVWRVSASCLVVAGGLVLVFVFVWHPTGVEAPTEWLSISTGRLALVTTVLAVATVSAARQSAHLVEIAERDMQSNVLLVRATRRQSQLSEQALFESRRPVLVPCLDGPIVDPKPVSFTYDGSRSSDVQDFPVVLCFPDVSSDWFVLKIRNVGGGPAIIGRGSMDVTLSRGALGDIHGSVPSRVVAP